MLSVTSIEQPPIKRPPSIKRPVIKVPDNCRIEGKIKPLLSDRSHIFAVPTRAFSLLSPLLSGRQTLDTLL